MPTPGLIPPLPSPTLPYPDRPSYPLWLCREGAISLMEEALDRYVVQGLGNNITFLRSVFSNDK